MSSLSTGDVFEAFSDGLPFIWSNSLVKLFCVVEAVAWTCGFSMPIIVARIEVMMKKANQNMVYWEVYNGRVTVWDTLHFV